MKSKIQSKLSLPEDTKESIQDRLKLLFKGRSLRQTALDWGLPYSTLNNYFEKGATPGLNVVANVSQKENVSLEWLVFGTTKSLPQLPSDTESNEDSQALQAIIKTLEPRECRDLTKLLGRKGAETMLLLLNETNLKLMQLSEREKMAMMKLCDNTDPEVAKILRQLADLGRGESNDPVTKQAV